jgi:uncharacterized protein
MLMTSPSVPPAPAPAPAGAAPTAGSAPAEPLNPDRPYALVIRDTGAAGRGVFAAEDIPAGVLIEECPVVVIPEEQLQYLVKTPLEEYYFQWGGCGDQAAIALGYGSLYNHSRSPNAQYIKKYHARTIFFVALRAIGAGEEITVNYNGSPEDRRPVWFE